MPEILPADATRDHARLAALGLWDEEVYRGLMAFDRGEIDEAGFRARHTHRKAILVVDSTGFTEAGLLLGEVGSLVRIMRFQQVCEPVLRAGGAGLVRAFADDLVALFDSPRQALDTAFALHRRIAEIGADPLHLPSACVGIGYGEVFAFGPNLAMGNQMNLASKLGEDTAEAGETLVTEAVHAEVSGHPGAAFDLVTGRHAFPYYRVTAT